MSEFEVIGGEVGRLAFSQAVRAGGFVFVSGQPGVDAQGRPGPDATTQAELAFAGIAAQLKKAGSDLAHVVRFTTLLRSMSDLSAVVEVRRRVLTPPYPADTVAQVAGLARPEFLMEIDAVAVVRE